MNPTTLSSFSLVVDLDHDADGGNPVHSHDLGSRHLRQRRQRLHLGDRLRHLLGSVQQPERQRSAVPSTGRLRFGQSSLSFNASGQATGVSFTLYDAQTIAITATSVSPSGKTGVSPSLTVGPASAASFTITNPGAQTAGTAFTLAITAKDAYGNTATG